MIDEFLAFGKKVGFEESYHSGGIYFKRHGLGRASVEVLDRATILICESPKAVNGRESKSWVVPRVTLIGLEWGIA